MTALLQWARRLLTALLLATGIGIAASGLHSPAPPGALHAEPVVRNDRWVLIREARVDSAVEAIRRAAPFQPTRIPVPPTRASASVASVALPPPRPVLTLTAVGGGRSPVVILDGVPGMEGSRLVRVGDSLGGLTIRKIIRGVVTIVGYDTTWTLAVKEPQ